MAPPTRSVAAVAAGGLLAVLATTATAQFTTFSPPLTGATDFATGAPSCPPSSVGPIGIIFDAGHFFATDLCNHTTYRFPLSGGDFSSPEASAANGLTHGLAVS